MYHVLENNKPAILSSEEIWSNNKFDTIEKAIEYANDWLGQLGPVPLNWNGSSYDYNGYGDVICIVEKSETFLPNLEELFESTKKLIDEEGRNAGIKFISLSELNNKITIEKEKSDAIMKTVDELLDDTCPTGKFEKLNEKLKQNLNDDILNTPLTPITPWIPTTISFLFPGCGQLINDTYGRAILIFVLWCTFWICHLNLGWFSVMIISAIDAYLVSRSLKFKQLLKDFDV